MSTDRQINPPCELCGVETLVHSDHSGGWLECPACQHVQDLRLTPGHGRGRWTNSARGDYPTMANGGFDDAEVGAMLDEIDALRAKVAELDVVANAELNIIGPLDGRHVVVFNSADWEGVVDFQEMTEVWRQHFTDAHAKTVTDPGVIRAAEIVPLMVMVPDIGAIVHLPEHTMNQFGWYKQSLSNPGFPSPPPAWE